MAEIALGCITNPDGDDRTRRLAVDGAHAMKGNIMGEAGARRMGGGRAIAEMLKLHGARAMFGMGGFQLLPLYDGIRALGNETPRHIHVNDERSAAFAADGYGRVSGRPGLCDGTLGPGATNLITGLVEGLTAGSPIVAFTGDANRDHAGKNMTQETPRQAELLSLTSKELIRLERGPRIPEMIRRAFIGATSGRPGPVVVNVPENVTHGEWDFRADDFYADEAALGAAGRRIRPDRRAVARAAELIRAAERPLLLVGGGVHLSEAWDELAAFAERLGIPVAHTLSGKGAVACAHPLCLGLFGRFDRGANAAIREADLLIAAGFKFGEIATVRYSLMPPGARVVQIDIAPEELGKHQKLSVALWADCKAALSDLLDALADTAETQRSRRREYVAALQNWQRQWREEAQGRLQSAERPIGMARLCHELTTALARDGILVADGGFAAHWAGLFFETHRAGRFFIANRGNASIGYGVPGGLGAKLAAGRAPVIALTGDVGFNMSMGEVETAIRERIPLVIVVVNNAAAGYVKALQCALFDGRYQSSDLHETDYAAVAKALGCTGIRVQDADMLAGALKEAVTEQSGPVVIDVVTTRDPAQMLPGTDARTRVPIARGDRPI
jgi:acetolactate synthase-1/2/3 large subunit